MTENVTSCDVSKLSIGSSVCFLTPPGRGGIAVLQLAGETAGEILSDIFDNAANIQPGELRFGHLTENGETIDEAVVACISPDELELNIHGGSAVGRHTLDMLTATGAEMIPRDDSQTLNPCHPQFDNPAVGEEMLCVMETIASPKVLRAVTSQWRGGLSKLVNDGLADIEQAGLADELITAANRFDVMHKLLEPAEVVLAGAPNAGKSTLANRLVGRDVAIVHETAGTTRDWLRERILLDGIPVWLTDTAGLWDAAGLHEVDAEAVKRACKQITQADLVVLLTAGDEESPMPKQLDPQKVLRVRSKADICDYSDDTFAVSAKSDKGIAALRCEILNRLSLRAIDADEPAAFTQRQADLLMQASDELKANKFGDARKTLQQILNATDKVYIC